MDVFEVARFEAEPEAVRRCRHWVVGCLRDEIDAAVLSDVQLGTSELAANAVRHASGGAFRVELRRRDGTLRVSVHDDDPEVPTRHEVGPDSPGGRGLAIVEAIARRWGWSADPAGGKEVWFEVAAPDPAAVPPPG